MKSVLLKYRLNADHAVKFQIPTSLCGSHGSYLDSMFAWGSSHCWTGVIPVFNWFNCLGRVYVANSPLYKLIASLKVPSGIV